MKRLILLALLCTLGFTAGAQPLSQMFKPTDFSVGMDVRAGVNISNMVFFPVGGSLSRLDRMCGFNVGTGVDFQILEGVFVETGLLVTSRGGKDNTLGNKYFPVYAEMPLMLSLRVSLLDDLQLSLNFGGYGSAGIFGRAYTSSGAVLNFFGNGADSLAKPWDAGLTAGFGVTVRGRFKVGFRYSYGGVNFSNEPTRKDIGNFYSNSMSFHVGYVLF